MYLADRSTVLIHKKQYKHHNHTYQCHLPLSLSQWLCVSQPSMYHSHQALPLTLRGLPAKLLTCGRGPSCEPGPPPQTQHWAAQPSCSWTVITHNTRSVTTSLHWHIKIKSGNFFFIHHLFYNQPFSVIIQCTIVLRLVHTRFGVQNDCECKFFSGNSKAIQNSMVCSNNQKRPHHNIMTL